MSLAKFLRSIVGCRLLIISSANLLLPLISILPVKADYLIDKFRHVIASLQKEGCISITVAERKLIGLNFSRLCLLHNLS